MKNSIKRGLRKSISALFVSALMISSLSVNVLAINENDSNISEENVPTENVVTDNEDPIVVVSLGDSYSSGEGIEPFYGQNKPLVEKIKDRGWLAHRSQRSWPSMLKIPGVDGTMSDYDVEKVKKPNVQWYFVAASGAETKHIISEKQEKEALKISLEAFVDGRFEQYFDELPVQVDVFNKIEKGSVDYVTLTIGGNDVDFKGIITNCAVNNYYLHFGKGLQDKLDDLWKNIGKTEKHLKDVYETIEEKAGKQASIIVAGYPKLLDRKGGGILISEAEADAVNTKVSDFNDLIEKLIEGCKDAGKNIHFVDIEKAFEGHEAYSDDPWINEIKFLPRSEDIYDLSIASAYSMHPNEKGANVYAEYVNSEIKQIEAEKKDNDSGAYNEYLYHFSEYGSAGNVCFIDGYIGSDKIIKIPEEIEGVPVLIINDDAFMNNENLLKVTVPESVKVIGARAFSGCKNLLEIDLPETLWRIYDRAFADCSSLTNLIISKGIDEIPPYLCWSCSSLVSVELPEGIKKIGNSSFYFTEIEDVYIPDGVETVGSYAFGTSVKRVSIPENTKFNSGGAFGLENSFINYNGLTVGTIYYTFRKVS